MEGSDKMDINDKLHEFEESLEKTVDRDYRQIELNVEEEIKSAIEQELAEYEAKKQANYEKNIQKLEKDYNKKVYSYEISCKKEIIDEEKRLKNKIKEEAINLLLEFTESDKYKEYLENSITERTCKDCKY